MNMTPKEKADYMGRAFYLWADIGNAQVFRHRVVIEADNCGCADPLMLIMQVVINRDAERPIGGTLFHVNSEGDTVDEPIPFELHPDDVNNFYELR